MDNYKNKNINYGKKTPAAGKKGLIINLLILQIGIPLIYVNRKAENSFQYLTLKSLVIMAK